MQRERTDEQGGVVLSLVRGGVDTRPAPIVQAERTREAAAALIALAEVMDPDDPLKRSCGVLGECLRGRLIGRPVA